MKIVYINVAAYSAYSAKIVQWLTDNSKTKSENCAFLADRTNGRAYATVLRLSVCRLSVCNVMYWWLNGAS